ncbi:MAG: hypothetical protein QGG36_17885 [Pirellulaceae bacterium]|nr:hypothetical protein [Pirellulaceae bacterium]MDP7017680.1 hypothetical protein [Pirellulaceae bacterium]
MTESNDDFAPLLCAKCLRDLTPGAGDFYVVSIEAVADPTPPTIDEQPHGRDLKTEINNLIRDLHDVSAREAMDQVRRGVTIHLCRNCYGSWIENPAG